MLKSKNLGLVAPARYVHNNNKDNTKSYNDACRSKKIEKGVMIKPSSGYEREIDYRFETEEEIETEEECRKFQNKASFQKRNNSFSSSGPDSIIPEKKNQRKKLEFYCCDSLAIRPSGNSVKQAILKDKNINYQSDILSLCKQKVEDVTQPITTQNQAQKLQKSLEIRNLKPKPRYHRKIFDQRSKLLKNSMSEKLPFALEPYKVSDYELSLKNRQKLQNQFHIIIETDQITQCCL